MIFLTHFLIVKSNRSEDFETTQEIFSAGIHPFLQFYRQYILGYHVSWFPTPAIFDFSPRWLRFFFSIAMTLMLT